MFWLGETATAHDGSVNDSVRYHLSMNILRSFCTLYPEYKITVDVFKVHDEILEECRTKRFDIHKRKKHMVDTMYECIKAIEYYNKQEDKRFL